jgi:hypothetical protein
MNKLDGSCLETIFLVVVSFSVRLLLVTFIIFWIYYVVSCGGVDPQPSRIVLIVEEGIYIYHCRSNCGPQIEMKSEGIISILSDRHSVDGVGIVAPVIVVWPYAGCIVFFSRIFNQKMSMSL